MSASPTVLIERNQRFAFGKVVWQEVERFDNCPAHVDILRAVQRVQGVDFVAISRGGTSPSIALIEVKDYRDGKLPPHASIAKELAAKVLGTLVGATAAARSRQPGFAWKAAARRLVDPGCRVRVVLHIESPHWDTAADARAELAVLGELLEKQLAWLAQCDVVACCEAAPHIPDCQVSTPGPKP